MFHTLTADTANELWIKAAYMFCDDGPAIDQSGRGGPTQEVMHVGLTLNAPRQRWISARIPAMNPAFAIAEVIWIMCGRNDSALLNFFNPQLPRFAGSGITYQGAYGYRLRKFFGIDQFERAERALSMNPSTRQVVMQIWDTNSDFPDADGSPMNKDIPCNIASLLKVRNNRLEWTQIMRSNDLFRGFPHNVIQFSTIQEVLSGWLGLEPGPYHHYSDSLHLYDGDSDVPSHTDLVALPFNTDSLAIKKDESENAFQILSEFCDKLVRPDMPPKSILDLSSNIALPKGHHNFAIVLAADALRRRGMQEEASALMQQCTNGCLRFMFERWMKRCHG